MSMKESVKVKLVWKVEKFDAKTTEEIKEKQLKPIETIVTEPNVLLNEGISELIKLICGLGSPTAWSNANARLGVGNDATAPAATQTGLLGASQLYKGMNTGYPQEGTQQAIWQSDFVSGEAEWAWLEETVENGAVGLKNLCRQNTSLGTKPAGQTWRLTATITFS